MINFATVEAVRYGPELLPSCEYVSPTAGNEAEALNLTRLPRNLLVRLKDVRAARSLSAELRFKADNELFQAPAAAIPYRSKAIDTGVADASATTYLDDATKTWPADAFKYLLVEITAGTGKGQIREIASNTGTRITPVTAFDTAPDATSTYRITEPIIEPTQYDLLATSSIRLAVYAITDLTYYQICHGLWVWKRTIADKLALAIPLNAEERAINEELGIYKTVERGTLPAKIDRFLLYEYYPIYRETKTIRKDVPTAGISVETLGPKKYPEQFVVLEKISCERTEVAHNVRFTIWRDEDGSPASPFITLHTHAMHLDYDIPCFIPAMREIGLRLEADTEQTNYCCRYTFTTYRMTNILRARWFGEGPAELIKKVKGGIA